MAIWFESDYDLGVQKEDQSTQLSTGQREVSVGLSMKVPSGKECNFQADNYIGECDDGTLTRWTRNCNHLFCKSLF